MNVEKTDLTEKVLMKQKVPRNKVADGIDLEIYKRCGWTKPIENLTEEDELTLRKQWVKESVSDQSYILFEDLCNKYENEIWCPL